MTGLKIFRAKHDDAERMTAIAFAAKRHWGYPESWIEAWRSQLTITPEFVREHPVFLASDGREILGFAAMEFGGSVASILHLWISPLAMNQGVGAALFAECEAVARDAGARVLTVESDPHAEGFYQKMGAIRVGQVPADIQGVKRFLPRLEKPLT